MPTVRRNRATGQIVPAHFGGDRARPPEQPGLPRQIYNRGSRGQDIRYDVRGLPTNEQGHVYDQFGNTYDSGGLFVGGSRPQQDVPGLKPADQMDGDQWGAYLGGGPGAPGGGMSSFASDPALQQIMALGARSRESARAQHLASRKQAAIEYGDASGLDLDEATISAARDNPFSVIARRERERGETLGELEEALSRANLFYSGHRGTELGRHATTYQGFAYDDANRFRALMQEYDDALTRALLEADLREMEYLRGLGPDDYYGGGDEEWEDVDLPWYQLPREMLPPDDQLERALGSVPGPPARPNKRPRRGGGSSLAA